jgi:hypothetical protein
VAVAVPGALTSGARGDSSASAPISRRGAPECPVTWPISSWEHYPVLLEIMIEAFTKDRAPDLILPTDDSSQDPPVRSTFLTTPALRAGSSASGVG